MSEVSQPNELLIETAKRLTSYSVESIMLDGHVGQLHWVCSALLEENKRLKEEMNERETIVKTKLRIKQDAVDEAMTELKQTREELEQYKSLNKANSDSLLKEQSEVTRLSFELSAKDKVLEWYAEESAEIARAFYFGQSKLAIGERARSILSRYEVSHD